MKKILIIIFIVLILGFIGLNSGNLLQVGKQAEEKIVPTPTVEEVNVKASFTIITDQITRNFSNPKYHNKSQDVYITAENPSQISVKKAGIIWQDFFNTLPMKLTKNCLITGDGESLCESHGELKFYLNNVEDRDVLEKEIKMRDSLLVKYTSR